MKPLIVTLQIISFTLILGCNNKSAYEAWQRSDQWTCQKNPTANCGNRKNYEEYKTEREKLLKKEIPAREVVQGNQELNRCPYPAEPINWVLRYCALENHTDDEIALQQSECFKKSQPDLNSKNSPCQIKEKYKRLTCKILVEKHRTQESVTLCLEDPFIKPFFAGN